MNNSQSNTESTNNPNRQNSPGYCKRNQQRAKCIALWKPRTITFADNNIQCGNGHVPNLRNKGNDANNKTITWRCKAKITVIWKPRILNCKTVIEYTNSSNSNIRDKCDKELQDKTNQIWSLDIMPVRGSDTDPCVIDAEHAGTCLKSCCVMFK